MEDDLPSVTIILDDDEIHAIMDVEASFIEAMAEALRDAADILEAPDTKH